MRCHFSDKDEGSTCDPSELNIWTSSTVQNPSVLKSVDNLNGIEAKSYSDDLSTLYSLDSVSQSYKRKLLECEREEFEERFNKLHRKRQMLRATAKANLVVDDDDSFDEERKIYEQMEWIEGKSNAMTLHLWKDTDVDLSFQSISSGAPIMYIPKLNWREERHHLLRISMAKIRGVDDPETYLRRSVLINNTVKRLQKDVSNNYRCNSVASSIFHESFVLQHESNSWDLKNSNDEEICKDQPREPNLYNYSRSIDDNECTTSYIYSEPQTAIPYNFQLSLIAPLSSDKPVDSFQNEILQSSAIFSRSPQDDQIVCDPFRTLKQTSPIHLFSSQPCGLQYRNSTHEDTSNEYHESTSSSSILDSVVYHSLIASLET